MIFFSPSFWWGGMRQKVFHRSEEWRPSDWTIVGKMISPHVWMKQMPPGMSCRVNKLAKRWPPCAAVPLFKSMLLCLCVHCSSFRRLLGGIKRGSLSHHTGLAELEEKGIWLLSGNCRYSLFSALRGALLSCNSGCQVKERRLWDGVSSSPGLLNWLCYCRPVQGEGSARESGLRFM